jgi:hypothetical protein
MRQTITPPNIELGLFAKLKCIKALIHTWCTYTWTRSKNAKAIKMCAKIKLNRPIKVHKQSSKQAKCSLTRQGLLGGVVILLQGDANCALNTSWEVSGKERVLGLTIKLFNSGPSIVVTRKPMFYESPDKELVV